MVNPVSIEPSAPSQPPATPEALLAMLDHLRIEYRLYHHQPIFTVEEGLEIERTMPGIHCRNLFLRDKKGVMFLVSAANETRIDLKKLEKLLPSGRLSFGSPERLWTHLGVRPGSVCPYAVINDRAHLVDLVLDAYMMAGDIIHFHPLVNTMTVGLRPDDLMRFMAHIGRTPRIVDLGPAAPDDAQA